MARVAIVGEAPGRVAGPALTAAGASGRRIDGWLGGAASLVSRHNLFDYPVDDAWPPLVARAAAARLRVEALAGSSVVVLLGHRVAGAFGVDRVSWFSAVERARQTWYVAPHPSGRSRWWNVPGNVERAMVFWSCLASAAMEERR